MKKNKIIILLGFLLIIFFSCKGIKNENNQSIEFIQSKVMDHLFLIKNIPENDSLLKNELIRFLIKTPPDKKESTVVLFYRYTKYNSEFDDHNGTSYFIDHLSDPGGFSSEELSNYKEDKVASFTVSKCEKDKTELVGRLYFYRDKHNREIDTLLYKCK